MKVEDYLTSKNIDFKIFTHPAVFTCEESEKYRIYEKIKGIHSKNLFLKEKKSRRFYLVVLPAEKQLNLKKIEELSGDKIKFANDEDLQNILGLSKGSVSPFGLINDVENKTKLMIDSEVWESEFVSFHPNINTSTLELTKKDFQAYVQGVGNEWSII